MQINIPIKCSHQSLSPLKVQAQLLFTKRQCIPNLQTWVWVFAYGICPAATLLDSIQQIQTVICHLNRWLFWLQVKSHEHQSHITTSLQHCWPKEFIKRAAHLFRARNQRTPPPPHNWYWVDICPLFIDSISNFILPLVCFVTDFSLCLACVAFLLIS